MQTMDTLQSARSSLTEIDSTLGLFLASAPAREKTGGDDKNYPDTNKILCSTTGGRGAMRDLVERKPDVMDCNEIVPPTRCTEGQSIAVLEL